MKIFYKIVAVTGLIVMLVPPILFYFQRIEDGQMKLYMAIGTMLWFSGAIPWLGKKQTQN